MLYLKSFNEAIKVEKKKKNKKKKSDPYYLLVYNYMIGDSNGYKKTTVEVSLDNPFLERYYTLLNTLVPPSGHWGVILDDETIYKLYNQRILSKDDYRFLMRTLFQDDEVSDYFSTELENKYADEFFEGVTAGGDSYYVFENVDLFYVDEYGKKHKSKVTMVDDRLFDFLDDYDILSDNDNRKITFDIRSDIKKGEVDKIKKIFLPIINDESEDFSYEVDEKEIQMFTKSEHGLNVIKVKNDNDKMMWIVSFPKVTRRQSNWVSYKCKSIDAIEELYNDLLKKD